MLNHLTTLYLAEVSIDQSTILKTISDLMTVLMIIGVAIAAIAGVAALIVSRVVGEQERPQKYKFVRETLFVAILIVLFPAIVKWVLTLVGAGDKYQLQNGMIYLKNIFM